LPKKEGGIFSSEKFTMEFMKGNSGNKLSEGVFTFKYSNQKKYLTFVCDDSEFEELDLGTSKFKEFTFESNQATKVNVTLIKGELHRYK
jgi:hypothetical protein